MILSYHPMIEGDENRLCAGRQPNAEDQRAMASADALILPQGCYERLYRMARKTGRPIFPNYDARFGYPGKIGQARLFKETGVPFPETRTFSCVADFVGRRSAVDLAFPGVFKFDWGGEGETVCRIDSPQDLDPVLERAEAYEATGQRGFVLQEYIPTGGKSLRVVVIGDRLISYWRVHPDQAAFLSGVSAGARIDRDAAPDLQTSATAAVTHFCKKTGINLAGFDLLFRPDNSGTAASPPLFLEINYFFGRRGIGGSEAYYRLLNDAVERWLGSLNGTPGTEAKKWIST
jgi:ribosomal protein S6--L-glutamate ligase